MGNYGETDLYVNITKKNGDICSDHHPSLGARKEARDKKACERVRRQPRQVRKTPFPFRYRRWVHKGEIMGYHWPPDILEL